MNNEFLYHEVAVLFLMGHVDKMYSSSSSERPFGRVSKSWVQPADLCFSNKSYLIHVLKNVHLVPCEGGEGW